MIRRLLLILVAASQLAALPITTEPQAPAIGEPLTVTITLPDDSTRLLGFPDLGPLALLEPPRYSATTLTLTLLPLRSGAMTLPALPFVSGQRRFSTAALELMITAPQLPDRPQPLRPLPPPAASTRPAVLWLPLAAGLAGLALLLTVVIRRRRPPAKPQAPDSVDKLAELAATVNREQVADNPGWQQLIVRIERSRFAPHQGRSDDLQTLTAEWLRLRGEEP